MDRIIIDKQDLTFLEWTKSRESSGTAGSFLKSYMIINDQKIYFKLSNYNYIDGITGHENINEIIVDRLLEILGIEHLKYYLINSKIIIEEKQFDTFVCASKNFRKETEEKIPLDTFYDLKKQKGESIIDFCIRMNFEEMIYQMIVVDYLILNRDRHGANVEVLYNKKERKYRIAPLYDHGLSLLFNNTDDQLKSIDILEDKKTNSFIGTFSTFENLKLIPKDKFPKIQCLKESDKEYIFRDLDKVISIERITKLWEMIWKRWCIYENFCNQK